MRHRVGGRLPVEAGRPGCATLQDEQTFGLQNRAMHPPACVGGCMARELPAPGCSPAQRVSTLALGHPGVGLRPLEAPGFSRGRCHNVLPRLTNLLRMTASCGLGMQAGSRRTQRHKVVSAEYGSGLKPPAEYNARTAENEAALHACPRCTHLRRHASIWCRCSPWAPRRWSCR